MNTYSYKYYFRHLVKKNINIIYDIYLYSIFYEFCIFQQPPTQISYSSSTVKTSTTTSSTVKISTKTSFTSDSPVTSTSAIGSTVSELHNKKDSEIRQNPHLTQIKEHKFNISQKIKHSNIHVLRNFIFNNQCYHLSTTTALKMNLQLYIIKL